MPERYGLGNGSAGAYVAPGGNTVINRYAALSATVAAGGTEIALSSAVGFQASDLILVWQVQAGEYSSGTNNDVELGANAATGYYELARIQSISGSILALDHPLAHAYNAPGAQVVRVPEYTTVSVPAAAQITATPWDGSKGGIVAFLASGAVTLQGRVRVSGQGFRGGAFSLPWCNGSCAGAPADAQSAADDATCRMGRRGESFDLSAAGFGTNACGTGNRATGGGGGGHINAGGGGGGNGAAGSVGGNAWLSNADTGGSAGVAVSGSLMNALTFGGGGGGGQQNEGTGTAGGAGGGVVMIRALALAGAGRIEADGQQGANATSDGAGGGGAGGSVLVQVAQAASCEAIWARGAQGGSVANHGNGGGGGGGRVRLDAADASGCPVAVTGGPKGNGHVFPSGASGQGGDATANVGEMALGCETAACSGAAPVCDTASYACRACNADSECPSNMPVCNEGSCVQCNAANASACGGETPICDQASYQCVDLAGRPQNHGGNPTPGAGPTTPGSGATGLTPGSGATGGSGCSLHSGGAPAGSQAGGWLLVSLLALYFRRRRIVAKQA